MYRNPGPDRQVVSECTQCARTLAEAGIHGGASFRRWALVNHPDKVPASEREAKSALFARMNHCFDITEPDAEYCRHVQGTTRRRDADAIDRSNMARRTQERARQHEAERRRAEEEQQRHALYAEHQAAKRRQQVDRERELEAIREAMARSAEEVARRASEEHSQRQREQARIVEQTAAMARERRRAMRGEAVRRTAQQRTSAVNQRQRIARQTEIARGRTIHIPQQNLPSVKNRSQMPGQVLQKHHLLYTKKKALRFSRTFADGKTRSALPIKGPPATPPVKKNDTAPTVTPDKDKVPHHVQFNELHTKLVNESSTRKAQFEKLSKALRSSVRTTDDLGEKHRATASEVERLNAAQEVALARVRAVEEGQQHAKAAQTATETQISVLSTALAQDERRLNELEEQQTATRKIVTDSLGSATSRASGIPATTSLVAEENSTEMPLSYWDANCKDMGMRPLSGTLRELAVGAGIARSAYMPKAQLCDAIKVSRARWIELGKQQPRKK